MKWQILQKEVYFLDGSLRDIYVFDTTRREWEMWIDMVNNNYNVEFYNGQTEKKEDKIDKNAVFDFWDKKTDTTNSATVTMDKIIIKCYFFLEQEIENDITPQEIKTIADHNKLMNYLKDVSTVLNKKVILTTESYSGHEPQLITVDQDKIKINFG